MNDINVVGGNLFRIAAHYLDDATRWDEIARINGLSDPMLVGIQTIRLPSVTGPTGMPYGYP